MLGQLSLPGCTSAQGEELKAEPAQAPFVLQRCDGIQLTLALGPYGCLAACDLSVQVHLVRHKHKIILEFSAS